VWAALRALRGPARAGLRGAETTCIPLCGANPGVALKSASEVDKEGHRGALMQARAPTMGQPRRTQQALLGHLDGADTDAPRQYAPRPRRTVMNVLPSRTRSSPTDQWST
jgi:hypothetical protein